MKSVRNWGSQKNALEKEMFLPTLHPHPKGNNMHPSYKLIALAYTDTVKL